MEPDVLRMGMPSCLHLLYTSEMVPLDDPTEFDSTDGSLSYLNAYMFLSSCKVPCKHAIIFPFVKIPNVDE